MSTHDDDDYEVGYGRPPKATQFKKGQSGNPRGRPREAKGLTASLKRELAAKIMVTEGRDRRMISKREALAKRLIAKALGGDMKALVKLLDLDEQLFGPDGEEETKNRLAQPEAVDMDILRHFFEARGAPPSSEDDATEEDET